MKLEITKRKNIPNDFWNYGINPVTGLRVGKKIKPYRPLIK